MRRAILGGVLVVAAVAACSRGGTDTGKAAADLAVLHALDTKLAKLEADVASMATYQAIWDNELNYTRGLDRHDVELMPKSFWPEASISYSTQVKVADISSYANNGHSNAAAHQHHVTGLTLDVDGNTAHEEGYILYSSDMPRNKALDTPGAPTPGRALVGGKLTSLGTGRYENRYERRDGQWRMIVHEYTHDITMLLQPVDLCATACLGRWDRSDISYLRPLNPLSAEDWAARAEQSRSPHAAPAVAAR
ncbi:MAG: nuclear transport factor 2 family protein [Gammaproteobacteria bacterium]